MRNSDLLKALFALLQEHSDEHILGACTDWGAGEAAIQIGSKELTEAFRTMMTATGMNRFMSEVHCGESELYPEMDLFQFDLDAMDSVRMPDQTK